MSWRDLSFAQRACGGRYEVEGVFYTHANGVIRAARERGWAGTDGALIQRLRAGERTWEKLLRPTRAGGQAWRRTNQRKRDEMAAIIAALDARKDGAA